MKDWTSWGNDTLIHKFSTSYNRDSYDFLATMLREREGRGRGAGEGGGPIAPYKITSHTHSEF